jgi:hypothetical protein
MSGLRTYEEVVLWVSTEVCVVEEERRAHHISETTWTTTGDLEPLHGNNAPSQCAKSYELLVAYAFEFISSYICIAKVVKTAQRIPILNACKSAAHMADISTISTWTILPQVAETETYNCSRMNLP